MFQKRLSRLDVELMRKSAATRRAQALYNEAKRKIEEFYDIKIWRDPQVIAEWYTVLPTSSDVLRYLDKIRDRYGHLQDYKMARHFFEHNEVPPRRGFPPKGIYFSFGERISLPLVRNPELLVGCANEITLRVLLHETAHHVYNHRCSFSARAIISNNPELNFVNNALNEGLARYSEEKICPLKPNIFVKIYRWIESFADKYFNLAAELWCDHQKLLNYPKSSHKILMKYVHKANLFMRRKNWIYQVEYALKHNCYQLLNIYRAGYNFVDYVSQRLNLAPKYIIRCLTTHPPQTVEEILVPQKYVARIEYFTGKKN